MSKPSPRNATPLLLVAQQALGVSQAGLGELLGASRKTIARRQTHAHQLTPHEITTLTTALYPVDPELAADVAAAGGETLESLGLVVMAPPAAPTAPALEHLVDAVVMAAVEAGGGFSPQLRAVLLAAFERAGAMGLGVGEVVQGLRGKSAATR